MHPWDGCRLQVDAAYRARASVEAISGVSATSLSTLAALAALKRRMDHAAGLVT